ncbi:MAG TPA: hypothetical protein VNS81_09935 [Nocardioides sp.]|nr:hypothetical protein [Nocardioides sp.]
MPRRIATGALGLLVAGAGLGALGGWLWWTWWGPAPVGKIYDTAGGPHWYPDPFDPGVARDFGGTATYVVLGFALALAVGAAGALLTRRREVAGLLGVGVASVLAAVVMSMVGTAQSPPDPQHKAGHVAIGTKLPGHLHLTHGEIPLWGWLGDLVHDDDHVLELPTPYLAWPFGAMVGYLVVMVSVLNRPGDRGGDRWAPPELTSAAPAPPD